MGDCVNVGACVGKVTDIVGEIITVKGRYHYYDTTDEKYPNRCTVDDWSMTFNISQFRVYDDNSNPRFSGWNLDSYNKPENRSIDSSGNTHTINLKTGEEWVFTMNEFDWGTNSYPGGIFEEAIRKHNEDYKD